VERKSKKWIILLVGGIALAAILCGVSGLIFLKVKLGKRDSVAIEVVAQFPGASAEEVERQVTIPLEVTFAGTPGLRVVRSKSQFALSSLEMEFEDWVDWTAARQEVINRLATISQPLPSGVTPMISPVGSAVFRYTLVCPKDRMGHDIYTLNDLRALQDWVVEREFRTVPRVVDVVSSGGTIRRYEVHPDPDRLQRYGIRLEQLQTALANSNLTVGGDFVNQGQVAMTVRSVGLFGGGQDPVRKVLQMEDPQEAASQLRAEEVRRIQDIRKLVIASTDGNAIRVEDVVDGGRLAAGDMPGARGVVVGYRPRFAVAGIERRRDEDAWECNDDCVEGVVYLRPGEDAAAALKDILAKVAEMNAPGRLLPGVRLAVYHESAGSADNCFWIHATLPTNANLKETTALVRKARDCIRAYTEADRLAFTVGGPDDGSTPSGIHAARLFIGLKPAKDWPKTGSGKRGRTKTELMDEVAEELNNAVPAVSWERSPSAREGLRGEFVGSEDEPVLKIIGADLCVLEQLATRARAQVQEVEGVQRVRVLPLLGQNRLEFRIDPDKCAKWGLPIADVNNLIQGTVDGSRSSGMVEGEKTFDVTVRWPPRLCQDREAVLSLPVDATNGAAGVPVPAVGIAQQPRLRLRDLVSNVADDGARDALEPRNGAVAIYREQGKRLIMLRMNIRGRSIGSVRAAGTQTLLPTLPPGYELDWDSGP
jgi:Cu/Ag efflux pump CusA